MTGDANTIGPDGFTRLAETIANDAALVRLAKAEALHWAADDWPEDGMTRAEAQQWLTARADTLGDGA